MIPVKATEERVRERERELRAQVTALYPLRLDRNLTKRAVAAKYREIIVQQFPQLFSDPLLALQDGTQTSLTFVRSQR